MSYISLGTVLILFTSTSAKVLPNGSGRIVGGTPAYEGQFPYQISIRFRGQHGCGGAIYNKRWIVTAAHCMDGPVNYLCKIFTGATYISSGGTEYGIVKILIHPEYTPERQANDIALVKVRTDIEFNEFVQPIPLSTRYIRGGSKAIASGWGLTAYPGEIPDQMQFLELVTLENDDCRERQSPYPIWDTGICTFTKAREGMCEGDSGGPLVVDGELTGIVSWGRPCAIGYPDVFTRIYSFKSWIEENAII